MTPFDNVYLTTAPKEVADLCREGAASLTFAVPCPTLVPVIGTPTSNCPARCTEDRLFALSLPFLDTSGNNRGLLTVEGGSGAVSAGSCQRVANPDTIRIANGATYDLVHCMDGGMATGARGDTFYVVRVTDDVDTIEAVGIAKFVAAQLEFVTA